MSVGMGRYPKWPGDWRTGGDVDGTGSRTGRLLRHTCGVVRIVRGDPPADVGTDGLERSLVGPG